MAIYKITFTPSGSYFFGNEKNFKYPGSANLNKFGSMYYIKSECLPSQSTVLGALRYVLLPIKGFDKLKEQVNVDTIGPESFDITKPSQSFGHIKEISPLFITNGSEDFVQTPFDHNLSSPRKDDKNTYYTPFKEYEVYEWTSVGKRLYTKEYDAKKGIANSFLSLTDGHIEDQLFTSDVRTGINRDHRDLFKKEYKALLSGFSFAVVANIDDDSLYEKKYVVTLGQGKVPFAVHFTNCQYDSVDAFCEGVSNSITSIGKGRKRFYCFGNAFVDSVRLYENTLFSVIKTQDYRNFQTKDLGRFEKGGTLYRLLNAGSILIPDAEFDLQSKFSDKSSASSIGFNKFIMVGDTKNEK